jgi:hypothetical protein
VHNVSDVGQIEVHTAEPLVPGPSRPEVETAIAKLKKYKSPSSNQIPAEPIQAGGEMLLSAIHSLPLSSVCKRTIPTERPPLVREVSVNYLRIEDATWSA